MHKYEYKNKFNNYIHLIFQRTRENMYIYSKQQKVMLIYINNRLLQEKNDSDRCKTAFDTF